jgi:hypothetical protein
MAASINRRPHAGNGGSGGNSGEDIAVLHGDVNESGHRRLDITVLPVLPRRAVDLVKAAPSTVDAATQIAPRPIVTVVADDGLGAIPLNKLVFE